MDKKEFCDGQKLILSWIKKNFVMEKINFVMDKKEFCHKKNSFVMADVGHHTRRLMIKRNRLTRNQKFRSAIVVIC